MIGVAEGLDERGDVVHRPDLGEAHDGLPADLPIGPGEVRQGPLARGSARLRSRDRWQRRRQDRRERRGPDERGARGDGEGGDQGSAGRHQVRPISARNSDSSRIATLRRRASSALLPGSSPTIT